MKLPGFLKRRKTTEDTAPQPEKEARTSVDGPDFPMQSHQKLVLRESQLCLTIPQKAVDSLHISTKRFIEWRRYKMELHGHFVMSETTHTTRIEHLAHTDQYIAAIPSSWTAEGLTATRKQGPSALCEWNGKTLRIRIPLPQKNKKKKKQQKQQK